MNESPIAQQAATPESIKKSNKRKLIWGLVCLIGPTALIVGSLLLYAFVNFIFASTAPEAATTCPSGRDSIMMGACATENIEQSDTQGPLKTVLNVILFLVGAVSVLTWLPGMIVGIILIATRKPVPQA